MSVSLTVTFLVPSSSNRRYLFQIGDAQTVIIVPQTSAGRALDIRTYLSETHDVKAAEFVRKVRRLGKIRGVAVHFAAKRGKGSHGTLYYGSARTIVQNLKRELPVGTLHAMLEQLGLTLSDLQ